MASGSGSCGGVLPALCAADPWELSLDEVLKSYEQPINEEQAWAVCYQCCRGLRQNPELPGRIREPNSLLLQRDGSVRVREETPDPKQRDPLMAFTEPQMVQSLGFAIYRALDWGLDDSEERELSPQLEQLIDLMVNSNSEGGNSGAVDEGYEGQEEEEEVEGTPRVVRTFEHVLKVCAARLTDPREAQVHYQAVCRALFVETMELKAFLIKVQEAKQMLMKLRVDEETSSDKSIADLGNLRNTDWARLWVQLMRDLRQGVKLKKVQEKQFNPLPTEYQLTPFEMLMQDIRARNYNLRKVMVDGDIPPKVKKDAHQVILDFIRSRPPLKPVSERSLRPMAAKQSSLHEKILEEIRQERKLRPVEKQQTGQKAFGSLPCIISACSADVKSTSCINLSIPELSTQRQRPRVLLKAPTLAEMEEMNISEEEESPSAEMRRVTSSPLPLKRDRSFSEHDLTQLQNEMGSSQTRTLGAGGSEGRPRSGSMTAAAGPSSKRKSQMVSGESSPFCSDAGSLSSVEERTEASASSIRSNSSKHLWLEFSHPVESLALTLEEVINVRRVLVKAEMEKFFQSKDLYNSLKKGKICCCCRVRFPLFSWPAACFFCKRSVCGSCSQKMKMPSKKLPHIPVYTVGFESRPGAMSMKGNPPHRGDAFQCLRGTHWRSVEEEFPHIYAHGCVLKDVCRDCSCFVADVISTSRKSMDILNSTPCRSRRAQTYHPLPSHMGKRQ
ncbi:protein spire homolog 2 isoform X2 [Microcaecilia unicolor]|uniref:Protein spire homolog 2-like isoform X2 n=1 Tax=Microcaecilia unicolor TaxID=1415580 RepID=A0A6P7Y7A1_9AMPH|nr:protein spire homolog 2-like isoform X2 [Microcaecilia unicolor]